MVMYEDDADITRMCILLFDQSQTIANLALSASMPSSPPQVDIDVRIIPSCSDRLMCGHRAIRAADGIWKIATDMRGKQLKRCGQHSQLNSSDRTEYQ